MTAVIISLELSRAADQVSTTAYTPGDAVGYQRDVFEDYPMPNSREAEVNKLIQNIPEKVPVSAGPGHRNLAIREIRLPIWDKMGPDERASFDQIALRFGCNRYFRILRIPCYPVRDLSPCFCSELAKLLREI